MTYKEMILKEINKLIEKYRKLIVKNQSLYNGVTYKGEEYIQYEDAQEAYGCGMISKEDFEEISKLFDVNLRIKEDIELTRAKVLLFQIKVSIEELED